MNTVFHYYMIRPRCKQSYEAFLSFFNISKDSICVCKGMLHINYINHDDIQGCTFHLFKYRVQYIEYNYDEYQVIIKYSMSVKWHDFILKEI